MQNAQMHHMVMQQLMADTMKPGNSSNLPRLPVLNESQLVGVQKVRIPSVLVCVHTLFIYRPKQKLSLVLLLLKQI